MSTITIRPTLTHTASIEVNPGCVGVIIGRGGKNIQALVAEHRGIKVQGPRRGDIRQIFKISGPSTEVVHAAIAKIRDVASKWEKHSRRQVNRDTLRRQAGERALAERKAKIASGQFVSVNTRRSATNSQRVKSPGPALKSRKNRFDMLDSDNSDDEQESPVQVMRKVAARPLQGAWGTGAPKVTQTPPSSPKDDALLARKRIAQKAKKTHKVSSKLQLLVSDVQSTPPVPKYIGSWADAADDDSDDEEEDLFLA